MHPLKNLPRICGLLHTIWAQNLQEMQCKEKKKKYNSRNIRHWIDEAWNNVFMLGSKGKDKQGNRNENVFC